MTHSVPHLTGSLKNVRHARGYTRTRGTLGDYVWFDPDGRRFLRALDERCPERIVDAGNETDIRGVVMFVGNTV